ncbi:hypothetical protein [Deinococcus multiflagellatus]|uniref:DUF1656 domain-containing protein n=1 Tax=Deinococcus multiflagellatus TaxID=1656887 RepID=A0ABW1ZTF2_9DEIO|nr:hypothetical protein [Deinococcus multiflagellatus]MBZ9714511.1 hypothetical protein [Deinococcus multiflagellatus]
MSRISFGFHVVLAVAMGSDVTGLALLALVLTVQFALLSWGQPWWVVWTAYLRGVMRAAVVLACLGVLWMLVIG